MTKDTAAHAPLAGCTHNYDTAAHAGWRLAGGHIFLGRQEELEGLKKSFMEGRRLAERLRSINSESALEKEEPRGIKGRRNRETPSAKKEDQRKKVTIKKQGIRLKKEKPRSFKKEKKESPAVE